jgi:hypothetical protein
MKKPTTQEDMLEGIEANIAITARHIVWLRRELALLRIHSGPLEQRRVIRQQLVTLEDTLRLLKIRRVYASEVTVHESSSPEHPQVDQRPPTGGKAQPLTTR